MTPDALFASAGLIRGGSVQWGEPCLERRSGVYIVAVEGVVVYIGRTRRPLARRIHEFYKHRYGAARPHRGGQELLLLPGIRTVYWAVTLSAREAETLMLKAFEARFGCLPSANRRRGDLALTSGI